MMALCSPQIWYSSAHAPLRTVRRFGALKIGWRKLAKSLITQHVANGHSRSCSLISNICRVKTKTYIENEKNLFRAHAVEDITDENSTSSNENSRSK